MTLFETMFLAHLLGDWLLQTEWQAVNKGRSARALLTHVVVYHAVMFAAILWRRGGVDGRLLLSVLFLAVTHALLDRAGATGAIMRALRIIRDRSEERWLTLAVDQSIHLILIGIVALYLSG